MLPRFRPKRQAAGEGECQAAKLQPEAWGQPYLRLGQNMAAGQEAPTVGQNVPQIDEVGGIDQQVIQAGLPVIGLQGKFVRALPGEQVGGAYAEADRPGMGACNPAQGAKRTSRRLALDAEIVPVQPGEPDRVLNQTLVAGVNPEDGAEPRKNVQGAPLRADI